MLQIATLMTQKPSTVLLQAEDFRYDWDYNDKNYLEIILNYT